MKTNVKIYKGIIQLGDGQYDVPCYVIDDGNRVERVLSQREVVKLISGGRESGDLNRYLSAKNIQDFLPDNLKGGTKGLKINTGHDERENAISSNEIDYNALIIKVGSNVVNGVRTADVVDICNAYLKARQAGTLTFQQAKLAEQSEIFIAALAKTGIDAIVDEATGYQYFRKANELQAKLDFYIKDEYREWTKTFPREFFMHLYRLEGKVPPIEDRPYPKRFGKYVMHYIYDTLDPEIADFLRKNNPKPEGKKHHHQKFSDEGYKALSDHLFSILGIVKASINMERFKENLAFAFPNSRTQRRARIADGKKEGKDSLLALPMQSVYIQGQLSLFDLENDETA